jgi:hypothetical protein
LVKISFNVIVGKGYTIMEGKRFDWEAGDAVYVPPWCWHRHVRQQGPRLLHGALLTRPRKSKRSLRHVVSCGPLKG